MLYVSRLQYLSQVDELLHDIWLIFDELCDARGKGGVQMSQGLGQKQAQDRARLGKHLAAPRDLEREGRIRPV